MLDLGSIHASRKEQYAPREISIINTHTLHTHLLIDGLYHSDNVAVVENGVRTQASSHHQNPPVPAVFSRASLFQENKMHLLKLVVA